GKLALLRRATAAATAAALLLADLRLVFLFALLKKREGLVLRSERGVRCGRTQLRLRFLHRLHGLREQVRNGLEVRILLDELAVHPGQETFDLFAQLLLRQADDNRVLTELVRRHRALVALYVERRGDDLALLFGERVNLVLRAAATAAATALRLRLTEPLVERT